MQRAGLNRIDQNKVRRLFSAGVSLERISGAMEFPVAKLKNTVKGLKAPVVQDNSIDIAGISADIRAELIRDMVKMGIVDADAAAALEGSPSSEEEEFESEDEDDDLPDALKAPLEDVMIEVQDRD